MDGFLASETVYPHKLREGHQPGEFRWHPNADFCSGRSRIHHFPPARDGRRRALSPFEGNIWQLPSPTRMIPVGHYRWDIVEVVFTSILCWESVKMKAESGKEEWSYTSTFKGVPITPERMFELTPCNGTIWHPFEGAGLYMVYPFIKINNQPSVGGPTDMKGPRNIQFHCLEVICRNFLFYSGSGNCQPQLWPSFGICQPTAETTQSVGFWPHGFRRMKLKGVINDVVSHFHPWKIFQLEPNSMEVCFRSFSFLFMGDGCRWTGR